MTFEEAVKISNELRERMDAPFGYSDKELIESLYPEVLGRAFRKTNCGQCYRDALIEIICYLKKNGKMAEKLNFVLRSGVIINDQRFDGGKVYSNYNLTDDVAKRFLKQFPEMESLFEVIPSDFKKEKKKGTQ